MPHSNFPDVGRITWRQYAASAVDIHRPCGSLDHPRPDGPGVLLYTASRALNLGSASCLSREHRGSGRDALLARPGKPTQYVHWTDTHAPVTCLVGPPVGRPLGHTLPLRCLSAARDEVVGGDGGGCPAPLAACHLSLIHPLFGVLVAGASTRLRRAALRLLSIAPSLTLARARGDVTVGS